MKRIVLAIAALLVLASSALATSGIVAIDTMDWEGVNASVPTGAGSPYVGIQGSTAYWSVISVASPPWKGTSFAIQVNATGQNPATNPGAGLYTHKLGYAQCFAFGQWFYIKTLNSSGAAILRFADSANTNSGLQPLGTDHWVLSVDNTGSVTAKNNGGTLLGTYTTLLTAGQWYFIDVGCCIGDAGGGTGLLGAVNVNIYNASGALLTGPIANASAQTKASNIANYAIDRIADEAEFTSNAIYYFGPWYFRTAANASGTLGPRAFCKATATSDASVAYSTTGANNFGVVSQVPANAANYVSTATTSTEDLYGFGAFRSGCTSADGFMVEHNDETVAPGSRLGGGIAKISGVTTLSNYCGLTNGAYTFCQQWFAGSTKPTNFGLILGW